MLQQQDRRWTAQLNVQLSSAKVTIINEVFDSVLEVMDPIMVEMGTKLATLEGEIMMLKQNQSQEASVVQQSEDGQQIYVPGAFAARIQMPSVQQARRTPALQPMSRQSADEPVADFVVGDWRWRCHPAGICRLVGAT